MKEAFQHHVRLERYSGNPTRAVILGLIGGLVGTIGMDLFGVGLFLILGGPASLSVSIIGDAAARFLSLIGIDVAGGAPLGAALHYLIGLALGGLLGAVVSHVQVFHVDTIKKGVGLGILYVEIMSLPMLATAAIVLKMTATETAQWFGISFVMHLVYGLIFGLVVSYDLRAAARIQSGQNTVRTQQTRRAG
jgi:hypothetical protein